jgi:hypothetical protein
VTIDNIRSKIKENKEKKFLLEKKSRKMDEDACYAEELLTLARNLTPVEMEEHTTTGDAITVSLWEMKNFIKKKNLGNVTEMCREATKACRRFLFPQNK